MSTYAATTEIQTFFKNGWATQGRTEGIAYSEYTDEGKAFAEGSDPWVRISHNEIQTNQITMQNKPIRRSIGLITVQCFQRAKTGTASAEQMADAVMTIFRQFSIDGSSSGLIRNDPGINVTVPYIRDVQGV